MVDTHLHDRDLIPSGSTRYIKLGEAGAFARHCIADNEVGLAYSNVPHGLCERRDWEQVRRWLLTQGRSAGTASRQTGELRDFYELGADTLWVTFANGELWWCRAEPEVRWRPDRLDQLPRRRAVIGAWSSKSTQGQPLRTNDLSTRLTCVMGYRGAICRISEEAYLLRRLSGQVEPLVQEAEAAQKALKDLVGRLIQRLHDKEFEILIDLIFHASGWRRVSALGETQKDIDLLIEQIATGERAFVQVKSRATPAIFADYVERFRAFEGCSRMFFVCHSPSVSLSAIESPNDVEIWWLDAIAKRTVQAGLIEWLVKCVR